MPIYMNYEGIKGNVTAKGHEGWIELTAAQLGIDRHISTTNPSANRSVNPSALPPSEIAVNKVNDETSTLLVQESLTGQPKKVTIDFVELNNGKPRVYLSIELEGVMISSYQISGRRGDEVLDRPMESLSLNFTKITYSAKPAELPKKADNKSNKSMWDLIMAKQP